MQEVWENQKMKIRSENRTAEGHGQLSAGEKKKVLKNENLQD